MLRVVIADDEELARALLREYLADEPGIEIAGECGDGFGAVKAVNDLAPDVLFLDVQMPKLNGFEVAELIDPSVAVVFVTAYDQYAMKAFDAAAVDYLLKPFSAARLTSALNKVRARRPAALPSDLNTSARPPGQYCERIVVKDGPKVHVIPCLALDYAEAQDDYVGLRSAGKTWLKAQTITSLEKALDPARFLRLHRSYLVNLERIARMEANTKETWVAVLTDGTSIPVSRAGYVRFREVVK